MSEKSILIVDDHALLADCLAYALNSSGHLVKVVVPDTANQVLVAAGELEGPIVLLDLMLGPAGNGFDLIGPLRRLGCQVVVLTHVTQPEQLGAALAAGALGVLAKSACFEQTEIAVQRVLAQEPLHEPQQRQAFLAAHYASKAAESQQARRWNSLTLREQQVLDLLAAGRNVAEIASSSFVSVSTVRSQVRAIFSKLGVHNQLAAVAAHRHIAKHTQVWG